MALKLMMAEEVKQLVLAKLNEKIDIPILNEEMEAELLDLVWELLEEVLTEMKPD